MKSTSPPQNQKVKKINYIDSKNEGIIHDLQYDYYGRRLATCSQDGTIIIYDTHKPENVKKLTSFQAHQGPIWQICWSHPRFGDLLASCSFDRKVSVWNNDWQEINGHQEHSASVNCLAFASWEMGLKLASGSSDGSVVILSKRGDETWDKPYRFEAHEMGVNCLTWGPFTDTVK